MFVFGGAYNTAFGKMVMDPTTGHLRFTAQEIEAAAVATGMRTLWADGIEKVQAGLTTVDELRRILI